MKCCKLCGTQGRIVQSHLIPKFVMSWLKETGSGFLRRPITPNIKFQDLLKTPLLCEKCENLFSKQENYFSKNIFYPHLQNKANKLPYDRNLHYFLVSILWRILATTINEYKKERTEFITTLEDAEIQWRNYLLGKQDLITHDVHLFVTDIAQTFNIPVKRFNLYMARGIDGTIATNKNHCLIYAKFVRFCIFAHLTDYNPSEWVNTKINNGTGTLTIPQKILDGRIGDFLVSRVREATTLYNQKISKRQREKIMTHQRSILPEIINSDMGDALFMDSFSEIDKSFFPNRKIRRNESCPCGSGAKYKRCCGK